MKIGASPIEQFGCYKYLEHNRTIGHDNQTVEFHKRIMNKHGLGSFGKTKINIKK